MGADLESIQGKACWDDVNYLHRIGIRFAGSKGERQAARWIEKRFRELGLSGVHQQEFPCLHFDYSVCLLAVELQGRWQTVPSEPAAHSRSTPEEGLQVELLAVEKVPERSRQLRSWAGKALLIANSELCRFPHFKRLMAARPAAVLVYDDRFPNDWTVAIGFPRYWVDLISCPIVNIAHSTAWNLIRHQVDRIRLEVRTDICEAVSQNVVGEIRGRRFPGEILVISGHHDSVINNPGADDNATGVASVLALARCFSRSRPARTLRFISFGTEEQLSEGARYYALQARDVDRIRFVLNTDSIGAWMGRTEIYYTGPPELGKTLREVNEETGFPGHVLQELSPFSDHFPLNLQGVPAVWYYRKTYLAARHYHHSRLETPEVVSPQVLETTIRNQALLLHRLANAEAFPFPRQIPASQLRRLRQLARDWMGPRARKETRD